MENKPLKIGITGGIGVGKTTVSNFFVRVLAIPCYEADKEAKILMNKDLALVQEIKGLLGDDTYLNGVFNPRHVSERVMQDPGLTAKLNALVHPKVAEDFKHWWAQQNTPYILKEAALLVEAGSYKDCDRLVVVTAPDAIRIQRIQKRDPLRSSTEIQNIMARQLPESEKIKKAHHVIVNDGLEPLIPQLLRLHQEWLKDSSIKMV